jgi:hypothetical protein
MKTRKRFMSYAFEKRKHSNLWSGGFVGKAGKAFNSKAVKVFLMSTYQKN